jgi:hypothetical protein
VNADVLGRHIGTVTSKQEVETETDDQELSLGAIAREQSMDEECVRLTAQIGQDPNSRFVMDEQGILGYQQTDGRKYIMVPKAFVHSVMQHHHDKVWAGHQGITRNQELIKLRYYWSSLNKDVEDYVRKCHSCAQYKSGRVVHAPLGALPEPKDHLNLQALIFADPIQLLRGVIVICSFS